MLQCAPQLSPVSGMIQLAPLRTTLNSVAYKLCRFLLPSVEHNGVLHKGSAGVPLWPLSFSASPKAQDTPGTKVSLVAPLHTSGRLSQQWLALAHSAPESTTTGASRPKS